MINVEMLSTGDEVLHGQIIDTNAAWLADLFFEQGLPLTRRNTVGDNLESLVNVLRERSERCDVLIVNGGLGPTSDDRAGRRHGQRRRPGSARGVAGTDGALFLRAWPRDGPQQPQAG